MLFSLAYLACAAASTLVSVRGTSYISFWLPGGLYAAVLLLNPRRDWLWLCLATLPANLVFDLIHGTKFILIFCFFCANTVQAVTGAWLFRRFVTERPTLATLKEFLALMTFGALFSPMLGAAIGAGTLIWAGYSSSFTTSWELWRFWF
jgi:integral membrane sensor domain MASE1